VRSMPRALGAPASCRRDRVGAADSTYALQFGMVK